MRNVLLFIFFISLTGIVKAQDSIKTYMYGHSLLDHRPPLYATPSDETTVAHWIYLIASYDQNYFAATGQYGFLRQHATNVTNSNWWYDSVPGPWDYQQTPFSAADFDNVFIAPGNFIQDQAPYVNYWTDTVSPLDASNQIINWVQTQEPTANIYIYESWPDMGPYAPTTFPPSASQFANYNTYTLGGFHSWFEEYQDSLELAHPNTCVKMIPAGPAIAKILSTPPYSNIPLDSLYEDNAPHGRPSLYFLAGLVSYMTIYEKKAPANYAVPTLVHSTIRNNYNQLVDSIWSDLSLYTSANGSRVFCTTTPLDLSDIEEAQNGTMPYHQQVLYPNPSTTILHLNMELNGKLFSVIDFTGREVTKYKKLTQSTIDISQLSSGVYWLQIYEQGKIHHFKFIKK